MLDLDIELLRLSNTNPWEQICEGLWWRHSNQRAAIARWQKERREYKNAYTRKWRAKKMKDPAYREKQRIYNREKQRRLRARRLKASTSNPGLEE